MREDLIMALAEDITMVMILSIVIGLVAGWYFTYLHYHSHDPEVTDLVKRLPPSQIPAPAPHDKCQDCDKVKGCVTCHDGVQWAHTNDPMSRDIEEIAKSYLYTNILYDDVYVGNPTDKDCIDMFKAGAKWQRDQLLKDELDGEVTHGKNLTIPSLAYFLDRNDMAYGDKVKVIVIKKD